MASTNQRTGAPMPPPTSHATYARMPLALLLSAVEGTALRRYDGHFTILRFTTHWKAMFGTPDLDTGEGRASVDRPPSFPTLPLALIALLVRELP